MPDYVWFESQCYSGCWIYGVPGQGAHIWTARFGQHFVGGAVYQVFKGQGYECGALGVPVKDYGWVSEFGGGWGQWFEGGVIGYFGGQWKIIPGNYGQFAGRGGPDDVKPPAEDEPIQQTEVPDPPAAAKV